MSIHPRLKSAYEHLSALPLSWKGGLLIVLVLILGALTFGGIKVGRNLENRYKLKKIEAQEKQAQAAMAEADAKIKQAQVLEQAAKEKQVIIESRAKDAVQKEQEIDQRAQTAQQEINQNAKRDQDYINSDLTECQRCQDVCQRLKKLSDNSSVNYQCSPDACSDCANSSNSTAAANSSSRHNP